MTAEFEKGEKGQNLVFFAILIIVLIALAGLVIDGGFSLSKRREAQNAADAGALAGAEALCNGNPDLAIPQAIDYAVNRNHAESADVSLIPKTITVTATIPYEPFLMRIFGTEVVTVTASASAGCYVPCNIKGVLPVAWYCQPPPEDDPEWNDCGIKYQAPDATNPDLWVIMDSIKTLADICIDPATGAPAGGVDCDPDDDGVNEFTAGVCQYPPNSGLPADAFDCDTNNDGVNDIMAGGDDQTGGNRAWLDLNGSGSDSGNGSNELRQWVLHGFGGTLDDHTWFAGQSGVANDVFQAADDILGTIVLLPVFDNFPCSGLPEPNCPELYHTDPPDEWQDKTVVSNGASSTYYHVITYSAFKITCVDAPGTKNSVKPCPGKQAWIDSNPGLPENIMNNLKTIEGYFVETDAGSGKCDGLDAGVHTMYLNH